MTVVHYIFRQILDCLAWQDWDMRIGTDKSAYGTHGFSVVGSGATRKLFGPEVLS
jgi:hypothetical protein